MEIVLLSEDKTASRTGLLRALGALLGAEPDAAEWVTARTPRGKPYFVNHPELRFSLSDSGHRLACAFSDTEIGVDLQLHVRHLEAADARSEDISRLPRLLRLARRAYHPEEFAYVCAPLDNPAEAQQCVERLSSDSPADRETAAKIRGRFYRIWTAKEAWVKYTGRGIDDAFSANSILPETGALPEIHAANAVVSWQAADCCFSAVELDGPASLCVCCKEVRTVRIRSLPEG